MTTHARRPDGAHNALVQDVHGLLGRYAGMPKIEQIAMLGQIIGHLITELPENGYGPGEVMQAVALNIASGNQSSAQRMAEAVHGAVRQ